MEEIACICVRVMIQYCAGLPDGIRFGLVVRVKPSQLSWLFSLDSLTNDLGVIGRPFPILFDRCCPSTTATLSETLQFELHASETLHVARPQPAVHPAMLSLRPTNIICDCRQCEGSSQIYTQQLGDLGMASVALPTHGLLRSYERSMRRNPLATKMATCLVGFGAGDLVAQTLQFAKAPQLPEMPKRRLLAELDYGRIARMACFGALVAAPQMHIFFTWLDKVCLDWLASCWSCQMLNPRRSSGLNRDEIYGE